MTDVQSRLKRNDRGRGPHAKYLYPFMTQANLNAVFAAINGFSYMPFTIDWKGKPTINVGAPITVTQRDGSTFPSVILTNKAFYKGGLKATATALSYSAQRSETDYKGGLKQFVNAQLAKGIQIDEPYYEVTPVCQNKLIRVGGCTECISGDRSMCG